MVTIDSTSPIYPYVIFHHMLSGQPVPHNVVSWDLKHKRGRRAKHVHNEHGLVFAQKHIEPGKRDHSGVSVETEEFSSKHIIPIIKIPTTKFHELKDEIDKIQFAEGSEGLVIEITNEFVNRPKNWEKEPQ